MLHETYFFACSISFVILCRTIFFQSVFTESPENAFFAHRLILSCNDGPCRTIRLTFWQIVKWGILGGMVENHSSTLNYCIKHTAYLEKRATERGVLLWLYLSRNLKLYFLARSTIYWFLRGVMLISCEWKSGKSEINGDFPYIIYI